MTQTAPVAETTTTWNLDPTHTTVGFSAKHMMITTVRGTFSDVKGTIVVDAANPDRSSVEAEISVASISTGVEQRDGHLRSPDFLDADGFPTIAFRSTRIEGALASPGDRFKVVGELTIHGTTREVTLDATYEGQGQDPWGGQRISFSASTKIDRRDFGLTWNQVIEAGGVLVSNEIKLEIEAQAVKA
jgi:polyisoprenoid-binding protein YceI